MPSLYDLKLDRELGKPTLPGPTALLKDQRAVARALRLLYPGIKITLRSVRMQGDKKIVRELEV